MSELNREEIEKSVDYLNNVLINWDLWQTHHRRLTQAVSEVLALIKSQEEKIKELAEENERLKKAKYIFSTVDYCSEDLATALEEIKKLEAETKRLESLCASKDVIIGDLSRENEIYANGVEKVAENYYNLAKSDIVRKMQERLTSFFEADDIVRYNEVDADYINEQISKIANKLLEEKQ